MAEYMPWLRGQPPLSNSYRLVNIEPGVTRSQHFLEVINLGLYVKIS